MEISIGDILNVLKKRIVGIIIAGLVCSMIMFGYTYMFVTPQYTATAKLYVYNGKANNQNYISSVDLTAAKSLVDTYIVIIKSDSLMGQVANRLQESYPGITANHIISMFSAGSINSTEAFDVSITSQNPKMSKDIVNTIVECVPDEFKRIVKVGAVEVIDKAELPTVPEWPLKKNMALGGAVGVVVSTAIFVLIAIWDRTVYDKEMLTENFNLPIIGSIPYMESTTDEADKKNNKNNKGTVHRTVEHDVQMLLSEKTPFSVAEAYRMARTNIMYLPSEKKCKKYAMTSAFAAEGKTITSINLAITFAQNSKRVLLIDADMRKPRVKKNMGIKSSSGLSEYLAGITENPEIVKSPYENLDVLTSGKTSTSAAELLESHKMAKLLEMLEEDYDYIIIDTPPMNVVTDASVISKHINGYLFSVRCDYSDLDGIREAIRALEQVNANIVGFMINGIDPKTNMYGKYRYRYEKYGYKYGSYAYKYKAKDDERNNADK